MADRMRWLLLRGSQIAFMTALAGAMLAFYPKNAVVTAIKQPILMVGLSCAFVLYALERALYALSSSPAPSGRKRKAEAAPPPEIEGARFPTWFWIALAAYMGWFFVVWSFSPYPHHGVPRLALRVACLGCFFGVILFFPSRRERDRVLRLFLSIALLQAVYTFFQFAELDFMDRPRFDFGFPFRRVMGTLGNPGYLGGYLAGCLAVGAGFLFSLSPQRVRVQRLYWLCGVLVLISMVLTFSRSALLALTLTVVLLGVYAFTHRRRHPDMIAHALPFSPRVRWMVVLAGLAVAVGMAAWQQDLTLRIAQRLTGTGEVGALSGRKLMYRANLDMIAAHPLFGVGPGNYISFFRDFHRTEFGLVHDPSREVNEFAHSEFMQQAAELGLPGLAVYLLFLFSVLWPAARRLLREPPSRGNFLLLGVTAAILSGLVANLADVLLRQVSYSAFIWTLLGWMAAELWTRRAPASRPALAWLWLALLLPAWLSTSHAVREYLCDFYLYRAQANVYVREGRLPDPGAAVEAVERAVRMSPRNRPARYFQGTLYYGMQRYADARDVYTDLLANEGRFADVIYNLGTFHYFLAKQARERGDAPQADAEFAHAERFYRQAIEDYPYKPDYHSQLASTLWNTERLEEARESYLRAAELYEQRRLSQPLSAEDYENLATAYLRAERPAEAVVVYRQKLAADGGMADTHFLLGALHMSLQEFAAAVEQFEAAVENLGRQSGNRIGRHQALHYLGQCYLALGRIGEARQTLREALRLAPPHYSQLPALQQSLQLAESQ